MKLYSGPVSLFSRKVEIALGEKGLAFERVMVPFTQTRGYNPKRPEVVAANPKGQVPVLIDGELTIYDSTLILEYLEDAHPKPSLYPTAPADRARCRLWDLYADEVMLVPLRALMHRTEPHEPNAARWMECESQTGPAVALLNTRFGELERHIAGRDFFSGVFTIADISLFMVVHWAVRLAGPSLGPHPGLRVWYKRMRSRPTIAKIVEELAQADRTLSAPVAGAFAGLDG